MYPFIKLLTTAILILVLLSAGCTDTGGGSGSDPTPVGTEIPVHTEKPTVEPIQEPTATATQEAHWYDNRPHYNPAVIKADENLFGIEIEGIMYDENADIYIKMFDEDQNLVFKKEITTEIKSYDFSDDDYQKFMDDYGSPKVPIVMETDYERNLVAVKYEGSRDSFTHEAKYIEGESVTGYIADKIFFDTHGKHIYEVYDI